MKKVTLAILGTCLLPVLAGARPGDEKAHDRVRTFLVLRLADALDLSDEKALEVSRIIKKESGRRDELKEKRRAVEEKIRTALEKSPTDATAIAKLVQEANEIDEAFALIPEKTLTEVQKVLTPEQQARLVLFRPELREQMHKSLRKRLHKERSDRGAGFRERRERLATARDFQP